MRPPSFKMEVVPPEDQPNNHHHHRHKDDSTVDVSELELTKTSGGDTSNKLSASVSVAVAVAEDEDATECSSSFADTSSSRNDNNSNSALSDAEVESQFYGDSNRFASAFHGFDTVFHMRKKRLTSHWRSFIRPLIWRCKWAELRIKQFESQALKYTRDIAAHNRRKHLAADQYIQEGYSSRSFPFNSQSHRRKAMRRRKRKRVEDTTDTKLYMSQHIFFSYHENKKSDPDGTAMVDDFGNPVLTEQNTTSHEELGINNDWSFLKDNDNALEDILRKIDTVHSRVHKLKTQLDLVMSKNAGKFSSSENLSNIMPFDAQTSSIRSPTFSTCNGDAISVGGLYAPVLHISEYDMGDFVMPESVVSSYGEAIHIPDIIESTVGLLSSADVTQHQSQIGDSCENIVDNILIHNQTAEAEGHTFRKTENQHEVKQEELEKSGEEESVNPALESDTATKTKVPREQSTLRSCLASEFQFPKNKRKRGERKAGTGGWSRQCPGEPDSQ